MLPFFEKNVNFSIVIYFNIKLCYNVQRINENARRRSVCDARGVTMGFLERIGLGGRSLAAKRAKRAAELHGQAIKYVTERVEENDNVVGRGGSISVRNGELLLFSSDTILLRSDVTATEASYLLSGDGVVLTAPNKEEKGRVRSYIAYFVYYRK